MNHGHQRTTGAKRARPHPHSQRTNPTEEPTVQSSTNHARLAEKLASRELGFSDSQSLLAARHFGDPTKGNPKKRGSRHAGSGWRGIGHRTHHSRHAPPRTPAQWETAGCKILTHLIDRVNCNFPAFLHQSLKIPHSLARFRPCSITTRRTRVDDFQKTTVTRIVLEGWNGMSESTGLPNGVRALPRATPTPRPPSPTPVSRPTSFPDFAAGRFFLGIPVLIPVSRERTATKPRFTG